MHIYAAKSQKIESSKVVQTTAGPVFDTMIHIFHDRFHNYHYASTPYMSAEIGEETRYRRLI